MNAEWSFNATCLHIHIINKAPEADVSYLTPSQEELLRKNETILTDMSGFTTQANSPLDATPGSPILTLDAGFTDVDLKDIEFRNIYFTWDSQLMLNNGPTDWLQESPDSSSSMQM